MLSKISQTKTNPVCSHLYVESSKKSKLIESRLTVAGTRGWGVGNQVKVFMNDVMCNVTSLTTAWLKITETVDPKSSHHKEKHLFCSCTSW